MTGDRATLNRTATESSSQSGPRRRATAALMIATAMQALDATIANVALPQLEENLGGGIELGTWVVTSYLCASAVTATLTGWLRRSCGARQLFGAAIGLFVIASVLCSIAPSLATLIAFRLVQGAAAGIIQPLAQAMVLDLYPKHQHGRMLAVWGTTIMAGPVFGPILGGIVTDLACWRWIFALNVPLGAFALIGLWRVQIPEAASTKARMDGSGLLLLVVGVGSLQLALERSIGQAWSLSGEVIVEGAVAVLALAVIAERSRRSRFSLLELRLFRDVNFATSGFFNYTIAALLFTTIVFLPALSEGPLGYTATQAGLTLSPRGIATMATMVLMGCLIDRVDSRALVVAGLVITAGALEMIAQAQLERGEAWLASANAIQGVGVGLLFTPLSTLAFSSLPPELRTDAAGLYNLLRQLGCAAGVSIMTAVLQARLVAAAAERETGNLPSPSVDAATLAAYAGCFRIMAVVTVMILPGILLFRVLCPDKPNMQPRAASRHPGHDPILKPPYRW